MSTYNIFFCEDLTKIISLIIIIITGLPRSGKKAWKMNFFQVREKSRISIIVREIWKKNDKCQGKVREFEKFKKKVNW